MLEELWQYMMLQPWGHYLTYVATVSYMLALLIPHLPVKYTSRIPDWVMRIINFLAAKSAIAKAGEKAVLTDNNGNAKSIL